jgi:hypothetical protein
MVNTFSIGKVVLSGFGTEGGAAATACCLGNVLGEVIALCAVVSDHYHALRMPYYTGGCLEDAMVDIGGRVTNNHTGIEQESHKVEVEVFHALISLISDFESMP